MPVVHRMLKAAGRHEHRKDFRETEDIKEIARIAGLDLDQFKRDVADRSLLDRLVINADLSKAGDA